MLLAHLLGDCSGSLRLPLQCRTADPAVLGAVREAVTAFGCPADVHRQGNWSSVLLSSGHPSRPDPIAGWLDSLGLLGLRSRETFLPDAVMQLPRRQRALFLSHLWASGGTLGWRSGRAEIGVVELPIAAPDLDAVGLADQELLAISGPGTPIGATAGPVDLRRLEGAPLVLTPPGTSSRRLVEAAFAAWGLVASAAVEVAQREAIVPLILAGAGIGFVPSAQAEAARAQGAAVARLDPPLIRGIGLLQRRGRPSPAARAFLSMATA